MKTAFRNLNLIALPIAALLATACATVAAEPRQRSTSKQSRSLEPTSKECRM